MSGLFQRIARRPADPLDGANVPDQPDTPTQQSADATQQPDAPTQQLPVTAPEDVPPAPSAIPSVASLSAEEAPTTVQPAAGAPPPPPAAPSPSPTATTAAQDAVVERVARRPGFRERGRMRRRLRYLRRLRELQTRDLGGLVFDLRRFERKRDDLVHQKLDQMRACDDELRAIELALDERRELRDVHEPGIGGTCPRCFAIFGSTDHFCSTCGAALGGAVQGPAQVASAPAPPAQPAPPPAAPAAQQAPPQATPPAGADGSPQ